MDKIKLNELWKQVEHLGKIEHLNDETMLALGSVFGQMSSEIESLERTKQIAAERINSYKESLLRIWELEETDASKGYAESVRIAGKTLWLFIGQDKIG